MSSDALYSTIAMLSFPHTCTYTLHVSMKAFSQIDRNHDNPPCFSVSSSLFSSLYIFRSVSFSSLWREIKKER